MSSPSRIFSSYRSLGYISSEVPLVVRYITIRQEHLIVTAIGKSILTYGSKRLLLLTVSQPLDDDITCLAGDSHHIFSATKNTVQAWSAGTELVHTYNGHKNSVHLLLPFGLHLISIDTEGILNMWDINTEELYLEMTFNNKIFKITAIVHPATFVNKILLASHQGTMQLWNVKSAKLIYSFKSWNSPVTVLEQAPAVNVIAIGLQDGRIIIHNIKFDETIMAFTQEWGAVTSLSFRMDGQPMLASGSVQGHVALWNLEEKRLHSQIRDAHQSRIAGMKFLQNEPIMVTNSADNSLKMWIFDVSDGGGRLLRSREGHSAPPTKIQFYDKNGANILSAGEDSTLRSFSTVNDMLHKNLGQASYNRKAAKRTGVRHDTMKMPPIVDFAVEETREKEWDNIAACHRGISAVTTWNYGCCKMGNLKLRHEETKAKPTCLAISTCGNFVLVGYQSGHVDKFNIQSGIHRGQYGKDKAHNGCVCGIATDDLNQIVITIGNDKKIRFWKFKSLELFHTMKTDVIVNRCFLHRESGLLAMSLQDFSLKLLDVDTKRIVRQFEGHSGNITDFEFSNDARWLISASTDCTVRTWDIPTGRLIDCFVVDDVCIGLTVSPTGEYLATIHVDNLGIYLWVNRTLYMHVSLRPLPNDFEPKLQQLPCIGIDVGHDKEEKEDLSDVDLTFKSPEQISNELVTLSLLPDSRWKNLLALDIIKKRNKPKEPPKVPKAAPFFLPTISGLEFKFDLPSEDKSAKMSGSRILSSSAFQTRTEFAKHLEDADDGAGYIKAMMILKAMGPSAIELEIHSLSSDIGGSSFLLLSFMKMIDHVLSTNCDFEVAQAYLGLFLKIYGNEIATESVLRDFAQILLKNQTATWERIQAMFNQCQCVVSFLKNAPL